MAAMRSGRTSIFFSCLAPTCSVGVFFGNIWRAQKNLRASLMHQRFCARVCFLGNAQDISRFDAITALTNRTSKIEHDGALAGGLLMGAHGSLRPARSTLGLAPSLRCDHCREELGPGGCRYWHMQFCSAACITAYQRRLAPETKVKISQLEVLPESSAAA